SRSCGKRDGRESSSRNRCKPKSHLPPFPLEQPRGNDTRQRRARPPILVTEVGTPNKVGQDMPPRRQEDALQLVHLYAERGSPKYEKAAMRWIERYLTEREPRLQRLAELAAD